MATKSISKSVRISEEVYGYIMDTPGKGFNEKFETIILLAKKEEPMRLKVLADLQKSIDEKRRELYALFDQYGDLRDFYQLAIRIHRQLVELGEQLERASGEPQQPTNHD